MPIDHSVNLLKTLSSSEIGRIPHIPHAESTRSILPCQSRLRVLPSRDQEQVSVSNDRVSSRSLNNDLHLTPSGYHCFWGHQSGSRGALSGSEHAWASESRYWRSVSLRDSLDMSSDSFA